MMKKTAVCLLLVLLLSSVCHADITKGPTFTLTPSLPSPQGQYSPQVAFDGYNTYLVVWEQGADIYGSYYKQIYGARVRVSGGVSTVLDPSGFQISVTTNSQQAPRVSFGNGVFLVTWQELSATTGWDIRGTLVNSSGTIITPSGINIVNSASSQVTPDLTYDATNSRFFVVWNEPESSKIYGGRVMSDGTVMDSSPILLGSEVPGVFPMTPVVGTNGSGLLVTWSRKYRWETSSGIAINRYNLSGGLIGNVLNQGNGLWSDVSLTAWHSGQDGINPEPMHKIVSDGTDYTFTLTGVMQSRAYACFTIPIFHILSDGTFANKTSPLVADKNDTGFLGDIAYAGAAGYYVVWEGNLETTNDNTGKAEPYPNRNIYLTNVDKAVTSNPYYNSPVIIANTSGAELSPAIAANGNEALVVWEEDNLQASPSTSHVLKALVLNPLAVSIPFTVKETAGVETTGYPIDVVVPLEKGTFFDSSYFQVHNSADAVVNAQFSVLNSWSDGSIRHLLISFQPTVVAYTTSGTGIANYTLKNDGPGTVTGVTVNETSSTITVETGSGGVKFEVSKTAFNIFDKLWLDKDANGSYETLMIDAASTNGGKFVGLWGDQLDTARNDVTYTIEESGPMRAVIKASAPTLYYGEQLTDPAHEHGFAVRIYAYAGKPYVKVDYQLQNSAKNSKWSWPLFFDSMGLNFALNMTPENISVRADTGSGAVYSSAIGSGIKVKNIGPSSNRDTPDSVCNIEDGTGTVLATSNWDQSYLATSPPLSTFLDVDDGTKGVMVTTRNFWQMWPNGLSIDAYGKLSAELWPDWSCYWLDDGGILGYGGSCTNSTYPFRNYHNLIDMQHTYKEVLFYFHNTGVADADLQNLAKTVQYYPVGVVPTSQYQAASATLDMDGFIPISQPVSVTDTRRYQYATADFDLVQASTGANYKFGVNQFFFKDKVHKNDPKASGGHPISVAAFIATGNPSDYWNAHDQALADLNVEPQWMAGYNYASDNALLQMGLIKYGLGSWRNEYGPHEGFLDAAYPAGLWTWAKARDDLHGWHYRIEESYYLTGNPWIKDWYEFIAEFRKANLNDGQKQSSGESRETGHIIGNALQAYRSTGDSALLALIKPYIKNYLRPGTNPTIPNNKIFHQNAYYGHRPCVSGDACPTINGAGAFCDSVYEEGYLVRNLIEYMNEVKDTDPQGWAEAFQFVSGVMEWNTNYANFSQWNDPTKIPNAVSSKNSHTMIDPQAWYYVHTGKLKYLTHLENYRSGALVYTPNSDSNAGVPDYSAKDWSGDYVGRYGKFVWDNVPIRSDLTPPSAITNLGAHMVSSNLQVTFTKPSDAVKIHIVYSDKPITETSTLSSLSTNWWAAKTYGTNSISSPITFTPEGTVYYVAAFTFDANDNMSAISNVATVGTPSLVTCYADEDGDGWSPGSPVQLVACPSGYYQSVAHTSGDCDDSDAAVHPGATEICGDGIDNDCSGSDLSCSPESGNTGRIWFGSGEGAFGVKSDESGKVKW